MCVWLFMKIYAIHLAEYVYALSFYNHVFAEACISIINSRKFSNIYIHDKIEIIMAIILKLIITNYNYDNNNDASNN